MEMNNTNVKSYVCSKCDKVFKHLRSLRRHMKGCKGPKPGSSRTTNYDEPIVCSQCLTKYSRRDSYLRHLRNNNCNERIKVYYSCESCGKTFGRKDVLNRHMSSCGNEDMRRRRRKVVRSNCPSDNDGVKFVRSAFNKHLITYYIENNFDGLNSVTEGLPTVLSTFREILDSALPVMLPGRASAIAPFKVSEILFGGVDIICNNTQAMATFIICSAIRSILPLPIIKELPGGNMRISILQFRNSTPVGPLEVKSGIKDPDLLGNVVTWMGKTEGDAWHGDPCNKVQGSDMTLMPPFVQKDKPLRMFSTDICSSARLVYKSEVEVKGISGYRMVPGPEFFGDSRIYKREKCFCPGSLKNLTVPEKCLKAGVLDIASCLAVPAVLSLPHFMHADPEYQEPFIGLKPDPKKHSTFLDLQPLTGVPLQGFRRIQVNLKSNPTTAVKILRNMPKAFFPLIWLEEGMTLNDDLVSMLKDQALNVLNIVNIVKWVLIGSGIVMFIIGTGMGFIRMYSIF